MELLNTQSSENLDPKLKMTSLDEQAGILWSDAAHWIDSSTIDLSHYSFPIEPATFSLSNTLKGADTVNKSWFQAYSRGQLPGCFIAPINLNHLTEITIPIARYISTLAHIGKDWEQQSEHWQQSWAQPPMPSIVLIGSGLLVRIVTHSVIDQFKRLGAATPPHVVSKLLNHHLFRLLPDLTSKTGQYRLAGLNGPALDRATQHWPGEHLETQSVGSKPAERLEWHYLSLQILKESAKKQQKLLANELVAIANKQGLLFSAEAENNNLAEQLIIEASSIKDLEKLDKQAVISARLLLGYATENDIPQKSLLALCETLY